VIVAIEGVDSHGKSANHESAISEAANEVAGGLHHGLTLTSFTEVANQTTVRSHHDKRRLVPHPSPSRVLPPIGCTQVMAGRALPPEHVARRQYHGALFGESGTEKSLCPLHSMNFTTPCGTIDCGQLRGSCRASSGEASFSATKRAPHRARRPPPSGAIDRSTTERFFSTRFRKMPIALQVEALRVLQERELESRGGARPVPSTCASSQVERDLATLVAHGGFRADLYYRLSVSDLLPPLARASRRHSGPAAHLTEEIALRLGRPPRCCPPKP